MIIKSFNLNDLKSTTSKFFLFYGLNEGHKEQVIADFFLNNFKGDIIKYDENQILENNDIFFETCLNESLFETEKIILVSRVTSKLNEIVSVNISAEKYCFFNFLSFKSCISKSTFASFCNNNLLIIFS